MKRTLAVLALCFVVLSTVAPAAAAASAHPTPSATTDAPLLQADNATNATNGTTTPTDTPPTMAEQVRINPVDLGVDYQSVTIAEADRVYNTTGEFVMFTTTEPVDAARIPQSKASAEVLDGGQTVKVSYEDDAAPLDEPSLYTLQLYFEDESSLEADLYAEATSQSVAAADLQNYEGFIDEAESLAEEWGYDTDPESLESFITNLDEQAQLVDGFLTEHAARTIAWLMAGVMNPLNVLLGLSLLALAIWRYRSKHGELVDALSAMAGRYQQKLDRLEIDRQQAKRTADDDRLSEVPAIGSYADYYEDAFGVKSPAQLADLAAAGEARATSDGLEWVHNGVDDLNADNLHDAWLEPVLRHVQRERQVLNHLLEAVKWMETEHQLGAVYRETRDDLETMIDDVDRQQTQLKGSPPVTGDD
jgi:hypothetical protein